MNARVSFLSITLGLICLAGCTTNSISQVNDLTVFHRANFTFIMPDTQPALNEVTNQLEVMATPGEIEGLGFGVLSRGNLRDVGCTVSDLTGPGGATIPASAIDARVVQVWDQKGIRGKKFVTVRVCEGLLKDDTINLLDPRYTEQNLPAIPPEAAVRTDLQAGQSKGFYLVIHVPAEAAAGDYSGTVRIGTAARSVTPQLTVHVLPYRLDGPGKLIGMYFNDTTEDVPLPLYRARLAYLRSMGVDGLRIVPGPTLNADLREIKAAGFPGPILVWDEKPLLGPNGPAVVQRTSELLKANGYEPYIYGIDEPNNQQAARGEPKSSESELEVARMSKAQTALTTTALTKNTDDWLQGRGVVLDFPLFTVQNGSGIEEYVQRLRQQGANIQRQHPREGFYFGSWAENPRRNRFFTGFHLYASRLQAIYGWTFYAYHRRDTPQIYNDFDLEPNKKRWFTVYPTAEGCAPTLQSEAYREGVDDLRYLNTFLRIAQEKEAAGANVAALRTAVLRDVDSYLEYENRPEEESCSQYTDKQFEETRQRIIQATIQLLR